MDGTWTISELAERAAAALAAGESTQVSGRVRDMPNERLIRWYTTIGLVDPPLARRGRIALYGRRHLLQLIAVKRRQAAGRSIAEIQLELTAATDTKLEQIAALPDLDSFDTAATTSGSHSTNTPNTNPTGHPRTPPGSNRQPNRSADRASAAQNGSPSPTPAPLNAATSQTAAPTARAPYPTNTAPSGHPHATTPTTEAGEPETSAQPGRPAPRGDRPSGGSQPGPADDSLTSADETPSAAVGHTPDPEGRSRFWSARPDVPDVSYDRGLSVDYGTTPPATVQGVRLAPGLTLLLEISTLTGDDLAAIQAAAEPLLAELHRRGLVPSPTNPSAAPPRRSQ